MSDIAAADYLDAVASARGALRVTLRRRLRLAAFAIDRAVASDDPTWIRWCSQRLDRLGLIGQLVNAERDGHLDEAERLHREYVRLRQAV